MHNVADIHGRMVKLAVGFFDAAEQDALLKYPTAERLLRIVEHGVTVPFAQFLTYYLFHKKRPGKEGFRDYRQLGRQIGRALSDLEDWVTWNGESLNSAPDVGAQDRAIVERIGEAAALSVVGYVHGLHEADWERIPEHRGRHAPATFDYRYPEERASDGTRIVQVEAKGSAVADSAVVSANIQQQKRNLDRKKHSIREREVAGKYPYPADLRYGVIVALGVSNPLTCWLTDPPGEEGADPQRYRLLARMRFISDQISFLVPRSQLAASLATRLEALHSVSDPFELDSVPLFRGNGQPFEWDDLNAFGRPLAIFNHLSRVVDGPAVGTVVPLAGEGIFFVGIQQELFRIGVQQDFKSLLAYEQLGGSVDKYVRCIVSRGRAKRMGLEDFDEGQLPSASYISFEAAGTLHYGKGGTVFGNVQPLAQAGTRGLGRYD